MNIDELRCCLCRMIDAHITSPKDRASLHMKLRSPHTPPKKKKNLGAYDRKVARKISKTEKTKANKPKREAAYQRAIIAAGTGSWADQKATWADIELPCVLGKSARQCSIDLIGKTAAGKVVLCELKYADPETTSRSNSPTYALLELLIYHYHIRANAVDLENFNVWHSDPNKKNRAWSWMQCEDSKNMIFAVAANPAYWDRWKNGSWKKKILPEITAIKQELGSAFIIKFFNAPEANPLFSVQDKDGNDTRYEPQPLTGEWTEIEELK